MAGVGRSAALTAGAALATLVVDRAAKVAVEHALDEGEQLRGPFGIRLRRSVNDRGIAGATSPGANAALLAAGAALACGIAVSATAARRPALLQVGAGMVVGGMVANLVDRIGDGRVSDFLPTPLGVVNAADLALGGGLALAGVGLVLRR